MRHLIFWTPLCIFVLPAMYYFASEDRFWNTFLWAVQKSGPAAIKFCLYFYDYEFGVRILYGIIFSDAVHFVDDVSCVY